MEYLSDDQVVTLHGCSIRNRMEGFLPSSDLQFKGSPLNGALMVVSMATLHGSSRIGRFVVLP